MEFFFLLLFPLKEIASPLAVTPLENTDLLSTSTHLSVLGISHKQDHSTRGPLRLASFSRAVHTLAGVKTFISFLPLFES